MAPEVSSGRVARLRRLFREVLDGSRAVKKPSDARLFLEAVQINQPAGSCVETIVSSKSGVSAVGVSVRADLSPSAITSHTLPFIRFLSDPGIKYLVDGQLLRQLLITITHPQTLWKELVSLYHAYGIPQELLYPFAWLALELLSLPPSSGVDVLEDVRAIVGGERLLAADAHETRELGYKMKHAFQLRDLPGQQSPGDDGPGGRHDNDHANFRDVKIYPSRDELLSTEPPYYLKAKDVFDTDLSGRARVHLDNQFRLLREDMLAELREDIQAAMGAKKRGKRRSVVLSKLVPCGISTSASVGDRKMKFKEICLKVRCFGGLEFMESIESEEKRRKFLKDDPAKLRHQAFGALCCGDGVYAFAFVDRDVALLAESPPVVLLRFTDSQGLGSALSVLQRNLKAVSDVKFVVIDTPVFAYEPVLKGLQGLTDLPLHDVLINPSVAEPDFSPSAKIQLLATSLMDSSRKHDGVVPLSSRGAEVKLDDAQLAALISGLTRQVSLIQGPPGTGKSFIGAQIAHCMHQSSSLRILVISYTNHALDQFLGDLMQVGIPQDSIVRLGSKIKCAPNTLPLLLHQQKNSLLQTRNAWKIANGLESNAEAAAEQLADAFGNYVQLSASWNEISTHLEFEEPAFYDALCVPDDDTSWTRVGDGGNAVGPDYLFQRWKKGSDAGIFRQESMANAEIWSMPPPARNEHVDKWVKAIMAEKIKLVEESARRFDSIRSDVDTHSRESKVCMLRGKRVIGCTTTQAANHSALIRAAKPDVILVEEAGEILESHILTAMAPTVRQLILIGDHKQLRPKVNNYALSVEKGDGFDLNRSLFERLILQGAPHTTLCRQHRMAPEISLFPRRLTYPELLDGPRTSGRPSIRGLRDRVVFLNHGMPEDTDGAIKNRREPGSMASKKNIFEAQMVMRCLKYLGQQGYSSGQIVLLTPYLSQLRTITDMLRKNQHDMEINELDKCELLRAGLLSQADAKVNKAPVRVSTIDNYQGEESDIVIASLTRSNQPGDIGFMAAPERLNVLITRARNCLIMIGNMDTFISSKKGKDAWHPFFELLKDGHHLYDGLPTRCERHPERTALLKEPDDFDRSCPNGGCTEECAAVLECGIHTCERRCHRVTDHTKTECRQQVKKTCVRNHTCLVFCSRRQDGCGKCVAEDKEQERLIKRNLDMEQERAQRQEAYARELREIQDEIEHERRVRQYETEAEEQHKTLQQQKADLIALRETRSRVQEQKQQQKQVGAAGGKKSRAPVRPRGGSPEPGSASDDWEHSKRLEGVRSKPLDELMDMIGLEEVKREFISVKATVDTAVRQGSSLAKERFSCSLLGNPGTGKTTVARLYGQFLTSVGVIPGSCFTETTGSSLANSGVSGCKKMIDEILQDGGGVLFIDEAYQLTSGNNAGGTGVLDFLLPEVENLRGKVVFVLAGYSRQMEGFFAHNPGLPSRFPVEMRFDDYTDDELLRILELGIHNRYHGRMACEGGFEGLYCRIVARRVGRGRGSDGFGNARAVENVLAKIKRRQAMRLKQERRAGGQPNDFLFVKEDLIGPKPDEALPRCLAWKKLHELTGLAAVKESLNALVDSIQQNYERELAEQPLIQYSLNKVFLGNPGTGKTTVAKLYGEILLALGLLSKGEVVAKNPSDFVGGVLGETEKQTKGILAATVGKVLVIDEAYGLYGGGGGRGSTSDPYKTAAIDTIVAEVQSVPGDDRCVLLLGYKHQMEDMFQNVNPGLSRRFPLASAFNFDDFTDEELGIILGSKLKQQGYRASGQAKRVALEMLDRARNRPNFGNAGEIDIILNAAKAQHQTRLRKQKAKADDLLQPQDFDPEFDRAERSETNVAALFKDTVGCEETVALLEGYQATVRAMKSLELDPKDSIPFNFLFRGPPGTGKTTTAQKMGKVFYDMGFLATAEVVECSAADLVGQYIGQTAPKVQQLLDRALGRVLFIDEAYRLAEGSFAKEAIDELVDSITKGRYHKKLVIILAGYVDDINRLMSVNPGLTSRFPEVIDFRALAPDECISLLSQLLQSQKAKLALRGKELDLAIFEAPGRSSLVESVGFYFSKLATQDGWANARDVNTLARAMFRRLITSTGEPVTSHLLMTEKIVTDELQAMVTERESRAAPTPWKVRSSRLPQQRQDSGQLSTQQPNVSMRTEARQQVQREGEEEQSEEKKEEEEYELVDGYNDAHECLTARDGIRDKGVSDAVWEQLQRDRRAEDERESEYRRLAEAAQSARDHAREQIVKRLLEEKARREREAELREKLVTLKLCPVGFTWIRQDGGFRCAGGSHFFSDGQLPA